VFTDPPYGVDVQERDLKQAEVRGRRKDGKGVANDNLSLEDLSILLNDALGLAYAQTKPGGAWYVCSPPGDLMIMFGTVLNTLPKVNRHSLVWVKDQFVMGRADYHYRHETMFYGWKEGAAHTWNSDRKQDSVWEIPRPRRSPEHPTMKPLELVERAIRNSSVKGETVLDPFGGSGTTVVAAARLGRVGRCIEVDPSYVDVIVARLEAETGETATRVS